jgi:hypothetical protein
LVNEDSNTTDIFDKGGECASQIIPVGISTGFFENETLMPGLSWPARPGFSLCPIALQLRRYVLGICCGGLHHALVMTSFNRFWFPA